MLVLVQPVATETRFGAVLYDWDRPAVAALGSVSLVLSDQKYVDACSLLIVSLMSVR